MLASLAGACLATSRATEPVTGNGPLPPPPAVAPAPDAAGPPRSFTVVATGAIDGGLDPMPALERVRPLINDADLAICHIDRPLAPAPAAVPAALARLGYDTCSTAASRAVDGGRDGVARTLRRLDAAGLRHAGTARDAAEAATPTVIGVKGVRVAHLSYAAGLPTAPPLRTAPWLVNRIDPGKILAAARLARRAGARVVIVSLHWGARNRRAATPEQIALAQRLLAAKEIDLIVGHGAGVVQPFGKALNGKLVAYGLGRLLAAPREAGIITRFTFTRGTRGWRVTRAEFVPTYVDPGPPQRVVDVTGALADEQLDPARRAALSKVLRQTRRTVTSRGAAPVLASARSAPIPGVLRTHGSPGN